MGSYQNVHSGNLRKMLTRFDEPVVYRLPVGAQTIHLNDLVGRSIRLEFTGNIHCIHCGRGTKRSFSQGYCYPCFQSLAQCDSCIISPEKCHYDAGTCREPVWAEEFCMQDHIVYLANSSGIKVGITRASQLPTRWMDQGAVQAIPVLRARSRQQSGFLEVLFRQHISDRTNWRAMLKDETETLDLGAERDRLLTQCSEEIQELQEKFGLQAINVLTGIEAVEIRYPVLEYPEKITSINLDNTPVLEGVLQGMKGQYLILDTGVINIRKYGGYEIIFST